LLLTYSVASRTFLGRRPDFSLRELAVGKAFERGLVDVNSQTGRGWDRNVAVFGAEGIPLNLVAYVDEVDEIG
jgi:hypothetical protein